MKSTVELNELTEHIRHAADRENRLAGVAKESTSTSELPPVPEALPMPSSSGRSAGGHGATRPEVLLDGAASMLRGGRQKTTVAQSVPKVFRSLFRNQGGYNNVLLEATERLVEVNRTLTQQNIDLYDRVMDLHTWAHSAAEISAENRGWTLAATARLQAFSEERWSQLVERIERLESSAERSQQASAQPDAVSARSPTVSDQTEERLAAMSAHIEAIESERRALNDHLNRLRAQLAEQAEYIRTVHRHLDQLGAHVDSVCGQNSPA